MEQYLAPGIRVDLKPLSRTKMREESQTYETRIYDVLSEDRLEILMPMEQTKLILLPVNGEFSMYSYTGHGLFECEIRIIDRYKSNNAFILLVELESKLRKFQRREYYRFSCALNISTRELAQEENAAIEQGQRYLVPGLPLRKGIIVDISGGGLRFVTDQPYEKNSFIYCKYQLEDGGKAYEVIGKVLDGRKLENRTDAFEHRVQFESITIEDREAVIRFIFEEERKHRKKEKGI